MLNSILTWLATTALDWLIKRLTSAVQDYEKQVADEATQKGIDDANVKRYQEAKDRLARHSAAADLLNGVPGSP